MSQHSLRTFVIDITSFAISLPLSAFPYGASARKPALRCSTRKVNYNYLMLRLALMYELEPDKAF